MAKYKPKRLYYQTAYGIHPHSICSYVYPVAEGEDVVCISKESYKRALKNRTDGGIAGIVFRTDKTVLIEGIHY